MIDEQWINEWAAENGYKEWSCGQSPNVVVVGENGKKSFGEQELLLGELSPEYILHYRLGPAAYDPKKKEKRFMHGVHVSTEDRTHFLDKMPEHFVRWADLNDTQLVGCDLSLGEVGKFGTSVARDHPGKYRLYKIVSDRKVAYVLQKRIHKGEWKNITHGDMAVRPYRADRMAETIAEYNGKTEKPLVVAVPPCFLSDHSLLPERLEKRGIGYIGLFPR